MPVKLAMLPTQDHPAYSHCEDPALSWVWHKTKKEQFLPPKRSVSDVSTRKVITHSRGECVLHEVGQTETHGVLVKRASERWRKRNGEKGQLLYGQFLAFLGVCCVSTSNSDHCFSGIPVEVWMSHVRGKHIKNKCYSVTPPPRKTQDTVLLVWQHKRDLAVSWFWRQKKAALCKRFQYVLYSSVW